MEIKTDRDIRNSIKENSKDKSIGIICFVVFLIYLLFLSSVIIDLISIKIFPWPYRSGAGIEKIILSESIYWTQYAYHCLYFKIKDVMLVFIWTFGAFVVGICLGLFFNFILKSYKEQYSRNKIRKNLILLPLFDIRIYFFLLILVFFIFSVIYNEKTSELSGSSQGTFFFFALINIIPIINSGISLKYITAETENKRTIYAIFGIISLILSLAIFIFYNFSLGCL